MRSLERHRDVGAYALGVLDEAEAFRFEDHLMECPRCAAQVTEFGPATRQLMLFRQATPRIVHPLARPGPRLLDRLLSEVTTRRRAGRRRVLYAVAAAVVCAVAGPGAVLYASQGDAAAPVTATDARSGVWARITAEDETWGTDVRLEVRDGAARAPAGSSPWGATGPNRRSPAGWSPGTAPGRTPCAAGPPCIPARSTATRCGRRTASTW